MQSSRSRRGIELSNSPRSCTYVFINIEIFCFKQTVLVAGLLCVAESKVIYGKVWPLTSPCNSRQLHFQIDLFGENQQWLCFQSTGKWSPVNVLCKSTGPQQVEWGAQAHSSYMILLQENLIPSFLLSALAYQALCMPMDSHNQSWGPKAEARVLKWGHLKLSGEALGKKLKLKNDKCPVMEQDEPNACSSPSFPPI